MTNEMKMSDSKRWGYFFSTEVSISNYRVVQVRRKSLRVAIAITISTNGANYLHFSRKCKGAEAIAFISISASR